MYNYKNSNNKAHSISLTDHINMSPEDQKRLYHEYIHSSLNIKDITQANRGNTFRQNNPPERRHLNDNT